MNRDLLKAELMRDEGRRVRLYHDIRGIPTIGIGHNLEAKPISLRVVDLLFNEDVDDVEADLDRELPWWRTLDEERQRVVVNMAFNLGIEGLLTFKHTLSAIQEGRYEVAAQGMLKSKWARQVGARATRLAHRMRTGRSE